MQWYWWVLIAIAVVGIGYLKLKVLSNIQAKRKKAREAREDD